mmetsp:Transcript_42783/g.112553  ORF Transcript_42783/g.112553 Transcript_42783/m.112553 type:complete len:340 (+) Transcript_42783:788-1807(+)
MSFSSTRPRPFSETRTPESLPSWMRLRRTTGLPPLKMATPARAFADTSLSSISPRALSQMRMPTPLARATRLCRMYPQESVPLTTMQCPEADEISQSSITSTAPPSARTAPDIGAPSMAVCCSMTSFATRHDTRPLATCTTGPSTPMSVTEPNGPNATMSRGLTMSRRSWYVPGAISTVSCAFAQAIAPRMDEKQSGSEGSTMITSECGCGLTRPPGNIICARRRSFLRAGGTTQRTSAFPDCCSCSRRGDGNNEANSASSPPSGPHVRPRWRQVRDHSSRRTSSAFQHAGVARTGHRCDMTKTRRHATSSTMNVRTEREHCSRRASSRVPTDGCASTP